MRESGLINGSRVKCCFILLWGIILDGVFEDEGEEKVLGFEKIKI